MKTVGQCQDVGRKYEGCGFSTGRVEKALNKTHYKGGKSGKSWRFGINTRLCIFIVLWLLKN